MDLNDSVPKNLKGILVTPQDAASGKGSEVSLSSLYKDTILVLYFYPKDSTPGCTTEAQMFRDALGDIESLGASVIGVSRDDVASHCRFMGKQSLNFALFSDSDGSITEAFGVWGTKKMYGKEYMGIFRSTFIIRNGKVIMHYPKVNVKTHAAEVAEYLRSLF